MRAAQSGVIAQLRANDVTTGRGAAAGAARETIADGVEREAPGLCHSASDYDALGHEAVHQVHHADSQGVGDLAELGQRLCVTDRAFGSPALPTPGRRALPSPRTPMSKAGGPAPKICRSARS